MVNQQTMKNQMVCHKMWHLARICTVSTVKVHLKKTLKSKSQQAKSYTEFSNYLLLTSIFSKALSMTSLLKTKPSESI